jgi:photosystem II stability/assembly factor-like uncharacterized protein
MDFVDERHGWLLDWPADYGSSRLQATSDGGNAWVTLEHPCGQNAILMSFTSVTKGWAVCGGQGAGFFQDKALYRTADGGHVWSLVADYAMFSGAPRVSAIMPSGGHMTDLFFLDDQSGWLSTSRAGLVATRDGGTTWTHIEVNKPLGLNGDNLGGPVQFLSRTEGFLAWWVGGNALIRTADAGTTWAPMYPKDHPDLYTDIPWFLDDKVGIGFGTLTERGLVLRTQDGGASWSRVGKLPETPHDASFADTALGWAVVMGSLYATFDGGANWQTILSPPEPMDPFEAVSVVDRNVGYVVTRSGFVFASRDGGQNFDEVARPETDPVIADLAFADHQHGWRLAARSLTETRDGGQSWVPVSLGYPAFSVAAHPGGGWWVVAVDWDQKNRSGLVLFTKDGREWTEYDFGGLEVSHIRFVDPMTGWIVADGRLFRTNDGGESWLELD